MSKSSENVFWAFIYCVRYSVCQILKKFVDLFFWTTYISNVVSGQQYLGHRDSQMAEQAIPQAHESALANSSKSLSFVNANNSL